MQVFYLTAFGARAAIAVWGLTLFPAALASQQRADPDFRPLRNSSSDLCLVRPDTGSRYSRRLARRTPNPHAVCAGLVVSLVTWHIGVCGCRMVCCKTMAD